MNLERIVQIHIAALTVIGAMLLGMGQLNLLLPLLVLFAAVTSIIFTDALNWFRLNRVMANLAALIALFFSVDEFFQADSRSQLLAIANLLTYLQVVLFYQRKSDRIYWQLAVLSLLQVMVSAALNVGLGFGLVLVVYTGTAISTLGFFFLHRELSRVSPRPRPEEGRRPSPAETADERPARNRWTRWLDRTPVPAPVAIAGGVTRRLVGWPFLQQLIVIGLTTMVFTVVLFFSAPRLDNASRQTMHVRATHVVGFAPEITLNELHDILQDSKPVMRVSLRSAATGQPYRVYNEPYYRGSVLTEYDVSTGVSRWRQRGSGKAFTNDLPVMIRDQANLLMQRVARNMQRMDNWDLADPPEGVELIRQDIMLAPLDDAVLFAAYPAYRLQDTSRDVRINPRTRQMYSRHRARGRINSEYRYTAGTTAFRAGLQVSVTPHDNPLETEQDHLLLALEKFELLRFETARFPRLKAIADEAAAGLGPAPARADLARALQNHLQDETRYNYTLDFSQVRRDPTLDPLEDFVANHRSGHCEYFASALVMMLRSQGIPARLVIGFKGGEYNTLGDYHQVYQSDAHAWVEAYLEPQDVDRELPPGCDTSRAGGWLRLDPTPQDVDDNSAQLERSVIDVVDDMLDYAQLLWTDYILGMSASRQRESIYAPVAESANPDAWTAFFEFIGSQRGQTLRRIGRFLFSGTGVLAALAVGLTLAWLQLRARRLPRAARPISVRRWFRGKGDLLTGPIAARHRLPVAFYDRLERLLKSMGIERQSGQTPREFAVQAARRLTELEYPNDTATLPGQIVAMFYRVRFGGAPLEDAEVQSISRELDAFEQQTQPPSLEGPQR